MKQSGYLVLGIGVLSLLTLLAYQVYRYVDNAESDTPTPPAEVAQILATEQITIAGSQSTTLRWIADGDDFISVNLAAQSYGLGFMSKGRFDDIEQRLLAATTPEVANNASSTLAGQTGFRVAGHACIIGFTYSDTGETFVIEPDAQREVYGIIVCSQN